MIEFSYFLGVDQTGAATHQGKKAKPLKVSLAKKDKGGWKIFTQEDSKSPLTLKSLSPSSLTQLLNEFKISWPSPEVAIIADCVFGMPKGVFPTAQGRTPEQNLWKLFTQTLNHTQDNSIFGLKVSESFFSKFILTNKTPPKRECERISGSNSLFTTRPFQKNIQTGSYRIWRDLVSETKEPWLNVWPFVSEDTFNPKTGWIFEGYPSFVWRELLRLRSRNSLDLVQTLTSTPFKSRFTFDSYSMIKSDPDLCDATVLALGGVLLQDQKKLLTPFPGFWKLDAKSYEGWISGIKPNK